MKQFLRTRLSVIAAALWIGLGAIFFGVGGDDPSHVALVGNINVDGQPLDRGTISFFLVSPTTQPVSGGAFIRHGRFTLDQASALVPGRYLVRVSGLGVEAMLASAGRELDAFPPAEPLPDKFNEKSELEVVIPHGGMRHLQFNL